MWLSPRVAWTIFLCLAAIMGCAPRSSLEIPRRVADAGNPAAGPVLPGRAPGDVPGDVPGGPPQDGGAVVDAGPRHDSGVPLEDAGPTLPDAGFPDAGFPDAGPPTGIDSASVFTRLRPTCVVCHDEGTTQPYFQSITSFQNLLVSDESLVRPGDPENSELVRLLTGTSEGTYQQMPLGERSFAELAEAGETLISMPEIIDWIANLSSSGGASNDGNTRYARRKSAAEIRSALYAQLGLEDADFFTWNPQYEYLYVQGGDRFPLRGPSEYGAFYTGSNDPKVGQTHNRWLALGGEDPLQQVESTREMAPVFLHTMTQVSQAWCRRSLAKHGNESPLLQHVTLSSTSATSAIEIQRNLRTLYLLMLGHVASDDEVSRLYQQVFLTYEPEGAEAAWTAVCAALIRHPLWMTY